MSHVRERTGARSGERFAQIKAAASVDAKLVAMPSRERLHVGIVSPVIATKHAGNAHTSQRYASLLRSAGHRVTLLGAWNAEPVDALIVLNAKKSAASALAFRRARPRGGLIVVCTGTDVYRDIERSARARRALACADAIITLQPLAIRRLPAAQRRKAIAIVQSAPAPTTRSSRRGGTLHVAVLGHLRYEKDPLRAAYALETLRGESIAITQAGASLRPSYARAVERIAARDARYRYLGEISHARALHVLDRSDVLVLSSRMEGGANVLSEAIAAGTAVVASRIDGNLGILGRAYRGYFPVGDTARCAALLHRCANDPAFLRELRAQVRALQPLVRPHRERALLCETLARVTTRR